MLTGVSSGSLWLEDENQYRITKEGKFWDASELSPPNSNKKKKHNEGKAAISHFKSQFVMQCNHSPSRGSQAAFWVLPFSHSEQLNYHLLLKWMQEWCRFNSPAMFYGVFGCWCEYCNSVKQTQLNKTKAFFCLYNDFKRFLNNSTEMHKDILQRLPKMWEAKLLTFASLI